MWPWTGGFILQFRVLCLQTLGISSCGSCDVNEIRSHGTFSRTAVAVSAPDSRKAILVHCIDVPPPLPIIAMSPNGNSLSTTKDGDNADSWKRSWNSCHRYKWPLHVIRLINEQKSRRPFLQTRQQQNWYKLLPTYKENTELKRAAFYGPQAAYSNKRLSGQIDWLIIYTVRLGGTGKCTTQCAPVVVEASPRIL